MGYLKINNLYKDNSIMAFRECYALEKVHGCVHESTIICMADGTEKSIKDIKIGDQVKTYLVEDDKFGSSIVLDKIVQPVTNKLKWYNLTFDNGKNLLCTEDHPIYTKNRGWVEARHLSFDDDIVGDSEWMTNPKQNTENTQENAEKD